MVEVDGEVVLSQRRLVFRQRYTEEWSHPALGETTVALSKLLLGGQGEFTMLMAIGEERVPLVEVDRSWRGPRALIGLQTAAPGTSDALWKSLSHTAVESMGDARWLAACRLLELSRQSNAMTAEMRETANLLQGALRRSFEARQRLGDDALEMLGAPDAAQLTAVRAALETRIAAALEAVKSLHMAVISIESQADETDELHRVQQTLEELQAEDEVDRFMNQQTLQRARSKNLLS
jgi:hypothetical protein